MQKCKMDDSKNVRTISTSIKLQKVDEISNIRKYPANFIVTKRQLSQFNKSI